MNIDYLFKTEESQLSNIIPGWLSDGEWLCFVLKITIDIIYYALQLYKEIEGSCSEDIYGIILNFS